jgi:hypothetical protein
MKIYRKTPKILTHFLIWGTKASLPWQPKQVPKLTIIDAGFPLKIFNSSQLFSGHNRPEKRVQKTKIVATFRAPRDGETLHRWWPWEK